MPRALIVLALLLVQPFGEAVQAQDMPAVPVGQVEEAALGPQVYKGHAIAMHGEPKYGPDFTHFDYANPHAPKGGDIKLGVQGTFDSFNPFIPKGSPGAGVGYLYESLLTPSGDEAFSEYGLLAESIEWPEDRSWVIFRLRPEARWHDGVPVTADDVIFSLNILKEKGHPFYRFYYQSIVKAEKLDERSVKFVFSEEEEDNRELPLIAGQINILPKHWWESRDFEKTSLEPPLGSGPYRIVDFEPGRRVIVERVEDYWGKDLAVNSGLNNFDRITYEYFRDETVIRQALKSSFLDLRQENQAKAWALDYDTPAVHDGWLKLDNIRNYNPTGMQAFVMNGRRSVFQDPRVRHALSYAFDFEWSNANLFFSQYARTESYFSNSELAATGLPEGEELEILDRFRGRIPDEVFTEIYKAPTTDGSGWPRDNLRRAFELLAEAGWEVRDMELVNVETGRPMSFEILLVSPAFERIVLPFKRNLNRLGIDVRIRLVDAAQYTNRLRSFDFDMIVGGWGQSDSPGNEQRSYWGSASADIPGSRNYLGIRDPAIDELIELLIAAPTREDLIIRTRALDRVLLWHHFVIPNWHSRFDRVAYWDKFGYPEITPKSGFDMSVWWLDKTKAKALEERRREEPETANLDKGSTVSSMISYLVIGLLFIVVVVAFRQLTRRPAT